MSRVRFDLDTLKRLAQFAAQRSSEDRIPQVAGSLTFTTMLSLVPLATVAFALFTAFPIFASFQMSLQIFLADHLMPAQLNSQIFNYLNQFASKAKGLTTIGMIFLFVTAVMTMMTVESAFNVIWRVRKARPIAQRILVYWAIITLGPILIGVSLSISSYLFTQSMAFTAAQHIPPVIEWALTGAALPLTALAFTMLYVYLPNCRVEWRDAVIGGVTAAIAFELAKRGFGYYVRRIPTYTAVYGAFAAVPLFLLWMYLCWFITLAGAMIASALPAIRIGQFHRPDFRGQQSVRFARTARAALGSARSGQARLHGAGALANASPRHGYHGQPAAKARGDRVDRALAGRRHASALPAAGESGADHGRASVRPVRDRSGGTRISARTGLYARGWPDACWRRWKTTS